MEIPLESEKAPRSRCGGVRAPPQDYQRLLAKDKVSLATRRELGVDMDPARWVSG
jgi:hypothetical protein